MFRHLLERIPFRRRVRLIKFPYETMSLALSDGSSCLIDDVAVDRWMVAEPWLGVPGLFSMLLLYEIEGGEFLDISYDGCRKSEEKWQVNYHSGVVLHAHRISGPDAVQWLRAYDFEVPERMQASVEELERLYAEARAYEENPPIRPFEEFHDSLDHLAVVGTADDADPIGYLQHLMPFLIEWLGRQADGKSGPGLTPPPARLFVRFPAGSQTLSQLTQGGGTEIDLLDLKWPDGTSEIVQLVRDLRDILKGPVSVQAAGHRNIEHSHRATHHEVDAAVAAVQERMSELAGLMEQLQQAIADFHSQTGEMRAVLIRDGEDYLIHLGKLETRVPGWVGFQNLEVLLAHPDVTFDPVSLADAKGKVAADFGSAIGELVDDEARQACQARLRELSREREEAIASGDMAALKEIDKEVAEIEQYLNGGTRPGGKSLPEVDDLKRLHDTLAKGINRAIREATDLDPVIREHLKATVQCRPVFVYRPAAVQDERLPPRG